MDRSKDIRAHNGEAQIDPRQKLHYDTLCEHTLIKSGINNLITNIPVSSILKPGNNEIIMKLLSEMSLLTQTPNECQKFNIPFIFTH